MNCKQTGELVELNGGTLKVLKGDDLPINITENFVYRCSSCPASVCCAWDGKSMTKPDERKAKPLSSCKIEWRRIPPLKWEEKKMGHGKELTAGFIPAPSNKVHKKCLKQMQWYCREANKKRQAPASPPQEEDAQEEQPQKKQKETPSLLRTVELGKAGELDLDEKEVLRDFALRDIEANGDGTLKLNGKRGRAQTFKKVTIAETEEPSKRTLRRRTKEMDAHIEAVNARLKNSYKTRNQQYLAFAESRRARAAGITLVQKLKKSNDDIDHVVSYLGLSLYQARKFIKMSRHRFGWKFGQTIDEHRAGKKERRLPTLYTTEFTLQPDGTTKPVIYKRVEDIGHFLASKISVLKSTDRFRAWDVGTHVPHGAVIVAPVVSNKREIEIKFKKKTQTQATHKQRASSPALCFLILLFFSNADRPRWPGTQKRRSNPKHRPTRLYRPVLCGW